MLTLMTLLSIFFGAALGASIRFWIGEICRLATPLPGWVAILFANLLGSLIVGFAFAWLASESSTLGHDASAALSLATINIQLATVFFITGFCGGLTTFSAFGLDNVMLLYQHKWTEAIFNIGTSIIFCTLAVFLGFYFAD